MIDIRLIRDDSKIVKDNIKKKNQPEKLPLVDKVKELDEKWRTLKAQADSLRAERNKISEKINEAKKEGRKIDDIIKKAKQLPEEIRILEEKTTQLENEIRQIMLVIPNIISPQTPSGKDSSENKEIKKWGKIPKFNFPVKNHVQLLESLKLADFDASAKVSGNGFYYLKNELAILNQALIRFTIDFMKKRKYEYIETPLMLNGKSIFASMDKNALENSVYSINGEDLHLIGTAEQSLLAMHSSQTLRESDLPKKYFAYSMCFRKEIGAHGINEKGLWRTHQFNKIEQFVFCRPEDSIKIYNELLENSEGILQSLELPYKIVEICTGDLGDWKYRSADFEVYRPTTKEYGEVMSLSNCTDYQARKLDIKCINEKGEKRVLHTLNNTAMATSRILVTLIENNQQEDGSIKIPRALWKYTGFKAIKPAKAEKKKVKKEKKKVIKRK